MRRCSGRHTRYRCSTSDLIVALQAAEWLHSRAKTLMRCCCRLNRRRRRRWFGSGGNSCKTPWQPDAQADDYTRAHTRALTAFSYCIKLKQAHFLLFSYQVLRFLQYCYIRNLKCCGPNRLKFTWTKLNIDFNSEELDLKSRLKYLCQSQNDTFRSLVGVVWLSCELRVNNSVKKTKDHQHLVLVLELR